MKMEFLSSQLKETIMNHKTTANNLIRIPWNKGKLIGQKLPLKLKEIWAIRIRLQLDKRTRELALLNLAIDSKLRGCDLVGLKVSDVAHKGAVFPHGPSSCRRKPGVPSSSKSPNKPVNR